MLLWSVISIFWLVFNGACVTLSLPLTSAIPVYQQQRGTKKLTVLIILNAIFSVDFVTVSGCVFTWFYVAAHVMQRVHGLVVTL